MTKITFSSKCIADIERAKTDCLVLPIFDDLKLGKFAKKLDLKNRNLLMRFFSLGDFKGKIGETTSIVSASMEKRRLLLIGCGKRSKLDQKDILQLKIM